MKEKGTVGAILGFTPPADGWHMAVVCEAPVLRVNENSGKESFYIPLQIDEDGEDNGKRVGLFINTRDENGTPYKSVEKKFADVLANVGLEEAFNAKFPGDVSYLDKEVVQAMIIKLPACRLQIKLQTKDSKTNITALDIKTADHSKDVAKAETPKPAAATSKANIGW